MRNPDPADWHIWIKENPPPSIQALVTKYGSFSAITPEAWNEHDAAMKQWDAARRDRLLGSRTWEIQSETNHEPRRRPRNSPLPKPHP